MLTQCKGYLLDEQKGDFVNDRGVKISFHKARFYDLDSRKIFKVSVPTDADALPEEQVHCELSFEVIAGEKFTKLAYRGYNFL